MADRIDEAMIEYVGILAKLELSDGEKAQAGKDMGRMLAYIDQMNELDTSKEEPLTHLFPVRNVFREDVVENADESGELLRSAPEVKNSMYVVPNTLGLG